MKRINSDDAPQVLHPFFGTSPVDECEAEAIVNKIWVELKCAGVFGAAFRGPMQPPQYVGKRQPGLW
jgi:hypothetical protein